MQARNSCGAASKQSSETQDGIGLAVLRGT